MPIFGGVDAGSVFIRAGLKVDEHGFREFEQKTIRAQRIKDINVRAGATIDHREFAKYEAQLEKTQKKAHLRDAYKATLGADYNPRAFNAYQRDLDKAEVKTKRFGGLVGGIFSSGGSAFAAVGGAYAIGAGLRSIIDASGEAEVSQQKLVAQLKANNESYKEHAKQIDAVIQKTSQLSGLDDEDLQDSFTNIVRVTGDVNKAMRLVGLAADFARAKHLDVAKAGEIVAKVAGGNIGILARYGIVIDKGATSTEALAKLQQKFGGQAEAYGKTQSGALDRVHVAFENLRETLGKRLAPTITRAADALAKFVDEVAQGRGKGGEFADTVKDIGDKIKNVGQFIKDHIELIKIAAGAWIAYKTAAGLAAGAGKVAAIGTAFTSLTGGGKAAAAKTPVGGAAAAGAGVGGLLAGATIIGGTVVLGNVIREAQNAKNAAKALGPLNDQLERLDAMGDRHGADRIAAQAVKIGSSAGGIRKLTAAAKDLADEGGSAFRRVNTTLDRAADHFDDYRKTGSNNLRGLRKATDDNMHFIRRTLGEDSAAGKQALAENFKLAAKAVREAMQDGKVSVRNGLAEIQKLMRKELAAYGISGGVASSIIKHGDIKAGGGAGAGKAAGGWIGQRGAAGQDTVPAMLGVGEAVLNRHQQAVIEGMLGDGFLDNLFANVQRPHYLAGGGRAGLQPAVSSLANRLVSQFGLAITSTTGGTHAPGSYHYQGLAADIGGAPGSMLKAADYLKTSGTYRSLLEGIHNPNLAVKNGAIFPGAGPFGSVWGNHANHIHIALRAMGAAGGGDLGSIVAPRTGSRGALGRIAQGALNAGARAANSRVAKLVGGLGGGDSAPAGVSSGKGAAGSAQVRAWAAAGLAAAGVPATAANISTIVGRIMQESGGNPNAINLNDSNARAGYPSRGLLQTIPQTFSAYHVAGTSNNIVNPVANVAAAVRYMLARYGHLVGAGPGGYGRGGRVRGFAKGGFVQTTGDARKLIRPLVRMNNDRKPAYERLVGSVDGLNKQYSIQERTYNLSDEELIKDDGSIDPAAIEQRAHELDLLAKIRQQIIDKYRAAERMAQRIIDSYDTILSRLNFSLGFARGKNRGGIRALIKDYTGKRNEWAGNLSEITGDLLPNATLDLQELQKEAAGVRGTTATASAGDGSTDTTAAGPTEDQTAIANQATARADDLVKQLGAANTVIRAFSSPGDIGTGTGAGTAYSALTGQGGTFSAGGGSPAQVTLVDGNGQAVGAPMQVVFQSYVPPSPQEAVRLGEYVTGGLNGQQARTSSVQRLGI